MAEERFDEDGYYRPPASSRKAKIELPPQQPLNYNPFSAFGAEELAVPNQGETVQRAALGTMDEAGELSAQEIVDLQAKAAKERLEAPKTAPIPGYEKTAQTFARDAEEKRKKFDSGPVTNPGFAKNKPPANLGASSDVQRQLSELAMKKEDTVAAERLSIIKKLGGKYEYVRDMYPEFFDGRVKLSPDDSGDWEEILEIYRRPNLKHGKALEKVVDKMMVRKGLRRPLRFIERFTGRKVA